MQEQVSGLKSGNLVSRGIPNDWQILCLIQSTYESTSTQQIKQSYQKLQSLFAQQQFIEKLFMFLQSQQINLTRAMNFKLSVSILIKKFSYQFSKRENVDKENFINKLFQLLLQKQNIKIKEQLGTALEYFLNHDTGFDYTPKIVLKLQENLKKSTQTQVFEGLTIASVACLNSLVQIDDQFQFFSKIITYFVQNLLVVIELLKVVPTQQLVFDDYKQTFKMITKAFDFIELAISRLVDQQDFISQKIGLIRNHLGLQSLFFSYLSNFRVQQSLISPIAQINLYKSTILQSISSLYEHSQMPQNIFNLLFITFLLESSKQSYQQEEQHILLVIVEILERYVKDQIYLDTFDDHKMQLMMCLFMYVSCKPQQIDMIEDQPEIFVQLAEQFTQPSDNSNKLKVRAASLLVCFVKKFDQALRNILQIVVIIITASMQQKDPNSPCRQLYTNLKQQFPQFPFFKLSIPFQLQTCFNMLSLLSPLINKREDLHKVVYALLITHLSNFQQVENKIVLLRLIRMIGYYPTAVYYAFVKDNMAKGKVFLLQGLKTFERIMKANKYPQIFELLAGIFSQIVGVININDSVFQTIIMNHYERILKKNLNLYISFLNKIRDTFINNIQTSTHNSLLCLGHVFSILNKQNQSSFRQKVREYFYEMEDYHKKVVQNYKLSLKYKPNQFQKKNLQKLQLYHQKFIQIYSLIANKQNYIDDRTTQFNLDSLVNIKSYNKNHQIFKLYNNFLLKVDGMFNEIQKFFNVFLVEINDMLKPQSNKKVDINRLQVLPNLSYLISQIIASFDYIKLSSNQLLSLLQLSQQCQVHLRQFILLIILSYTFKHPNQLKQKLRELNLYEDTLKLLLTTIYSDKLIRKIFLLSMTRLLQIQDKYFSDIIQQSIKYLKQQFKQNQTKVKSKPQYMDPKMRRMFENDNFFDNAQQEMIEQPKTTTISVPNFKHPLSSQSQYDQFKIKIWQNSHIVDKLNQQDKQGLREILQMDWVGKGVRKIVNVKQNIF